MASESQTTNHAAVLREVSRGGGGRVQYMEDAADHIERLQTALSELIECADAAGWSANIGTMDDAITKARSVLS